MTITTGRRVALEQAVHGTSLKGPRAARTRVFPCWITGRTVQRWPRHGRRPSGAYARTPGARWRARPSRRGGESAALVLRGEAGIGKSALLPLLRAVRRRVALVLQIAGVESEMQLPFAALHQLCARDARRPRTPCRQPQQEALRVALGLTAGPCSGPVRRRSGRTGPAGRRRRRRGPWSVSLDDAQWLDEPQRRRC